MTDRTLEAAATATTALVIAAAIGLPFAYERRVIHEGLPPGTRVVALTAVAVQGIWTEEAVDGENYWRRTFAPARPTIALGQETELRLASPDVTHVFYAPELGVGPLEVYPGHVVTARVTPTKRGVFPYYCTNFCGKRHFAMRGEIAVEPAGQPAPAATPVAAGTHDYWLAPQPPPGAPIVDRGRWTFESRGCVSCHGAGGRGGVPNFNYARGTVPALAGISERFLLFDPDDVKTVVSALDKGVPLETLADHTSIPQFAVALSQYHAVRNVIRNGSISAKQDPLGPEPPLQMPTWGGRLSDRDIDAVIAYLLTRPPPGGA